ncbi:FAD-dependent monooxygenase [Pedobacter sp. GSP4]|uniref:FAD-dependent monooxygenase n=1 Tax=Pedobacter sp. GSP4 TaxID=3453716 RepID=UPI003EE9DFDB
MMNTIFQNKKTVQNPSVYDVIIAGAGPVGLFLACELALAKCSVFILEKAEELFNPLKQVPFGIRGLSAPSIDAFYRRGLLQELELHKRLKNPHAHAGKETRRQVGHFAGIPFYEDDIDTTQWAYRLPTANPNSLISEMAEIETVLSQRATSLGVDIKRGFAISNFNQSEDAVTVESVSQTFKGKWLVGCDGSRSTVRKMGGFEFDGTEPEFTGYSVQVDIADPEQLKPGRNATAAGMYLQSQPGYLVIQEFDGGTAHHSKEPITLAQVQAVLRRVSATDVTLKALHTVTTWTDRARQATTYRNGRVFLAGDAAHIHSPLGGQGLNLGLGDAMNLGWKLAATIHQKAPNGLLDSYYTERYPIGAQVLDWSRAQVAIMKPEPQARALNAIFRDLISTRDGATYIANRVWGISTGYNLGDNHPLLGQSTPDFELNIGQKIGALMDDGKGILLDFTMNAQLKALAAEYSEQLNYISGHAANQLGLSTLLIRPDGIIAWLAENEVDYNELEKSLGLWFVRNSE